MLPDILKKLVAINSLLSNDKILPIAHDYFSDGCSKAEIIDNLISDGFSPSESSIAANIVYPEGIEEITNDSIIKSIDHEGQQVHWCPKHQVMIEKSTCDAIKCAHLKGIGLNHVKCAYWKISKESDR